MRSVRGSYISYISTPSHPASALSIKPSPSHGAEDTVARVVTCLYWIGKLLLVAVILVFLRLFPSVAETGLELTGILLPQSSKSWDYRCECFRAWFTVLFSCQENRKGDQLLWNQAINHPKRPLSVPRHFLIVLKIQHQTSAPKDSQSKVTAMCQESNSQLSSGMPVLAAA